MSTRDDEGLVGWKVLTHDERLPGPGSPRLLDDELPAELTGLRTSTWPGWTFYSDLATALRMSSLWPLGRPSMAIQVIVPHDTAVERYGDITYAPTLKLGARATDAQIEEAVDALSAVFAPHQADMAREQKKWRHALSRPRRDPRIVSDGLQAALTARGLLHWHLEPFETAEAVWSACGAWALDSSAEALSARDDWGYTDALAARTAWLSRQPPVAWRTWEPWTITDAEQTWPRDEVEVEKDLCGAKASFAAHFGLTVCLAALHGWIARPPALLTTGVRDAYEHGLEVVLPIAPHTLGWALANGGGRRPC